MMPTTGNPTRNRCAIFGGTFDPPHMGHLHIFHQVALLGRFSSLIVIPAKISNFKLGTHPAAFEDRYRMLSLLADDYRAEYPDDGLRIVLSDYEGMKEGISYSSDTVRHFFPEIAYDGKVDFIIGDDHLDALAGWHDWEYLRTHVRFICFTRNRGLHRIPDAVECIESPVLHASSSAIRSGRLEMLTPSVRRYIDDHQLYRALR